MNDDLRKAIRWGKAVGDDIRNLKEADLVDGIAGGQGVVGLREACAAELQRRATGQLKESVDRFSRDSGRQANRMIGLTVAIAVLTVALLLQGFGCLPAYPSDSINPASPAALLGSMPPPTSD